MRIVRATDLLQVAQGAEKIERLHFRSLYVVPYIDGQFIDRACRGVAAGTLHVASDDLHIEQPSRQERCGKELANGLRCAEKLGPALRVVAGQAEPGGDESGADAPDVVPRGLTADLATEKPHPRAEHHLLFLSRVQ